MTNEHWGVRLKRARQSKNWTQEQLAEAAGVSQSLITKIEALKAERSRYATKLAHALEVDVDWLTEGIEPGLYGRHRPDPDAFEVRDGPSIDSLCSFVAPYPVPASAELAQKVTEQMPVANFWHHDTLEVGGVSGAQLAMTAVLDAAMEPTIRMGEAVLIVVSGKPKLRDGEIYLVQWGEQPTFRRAIRRVGGSLTLTADNPDQLRFRPQEVPEDQEGLIIHGRAVWRGGWL